MGGKVSTIGFDADDTLWHNERYFQLTQARFAELLADFVDADDLSDRLLEAEKRNLGHYGFGVKGFTLSMIETAIEVTQGKVSTQVIQTLINAGQEMLAQPIELLPHARAAIEALSQTHELVLITKGDLLDQERKLAQSGLGDFFDAVEIVSDKTPAVYQSVFERHGGTGQGAMVGNSLKSDVIPALEAGAWGIHVPHDLTWGYEHAVPPVTHRKFRALADLSELAMMLRDLPHI
ncbi:HAD family hydrolase [Aliiroseovarius sp. 2305UL8-7]|uniref:HAD family hydrolase n=1 Tax=Aliiroseovarius conchicola TaxID=3121637 RepID=UPI0035286FEF